ncbi:Mannosidase_ alpha_ class 2A_ member 1 [Caligus rogercresseyi]|uniref:Mannosidase_ alpha_ class 2A_ member 1 n=1 Tax=Caligus rogercresseyi TaxID=217165 RepID=A0A7T8KBJ0_CALRO|nr:Mannosidase_ alpha_ class 2A_ member 1 [Caligus rogercresseyi]
MGYSNSNMNGVGYPFMKLIIEARESYALFQHHDGVTGTAKKHVMADYGQRMSKSINDLQSVMSQLSHFLLTPNKAFYDSSSNKRNELWFEFSEKADGGFKSLFSQRVLDTHGYEKGLIAFFNSHARARSEVVTLRITNPNIRLYTLNFVEGDEDEEEVPFQISPIFDDTHEILNGEFLLSFVVEVPALALKAYYFNELRAEEGTNP